jgi:hypothetical protein
MPRVTADTFIHCRVPAATKSAFSAMARRQEMKDSALLKRMIELALQSANVVSGSTAVATVDARSVGEPPGPVSRLTVRLRAEDQLLLRERATARGMAPATYVAVYVRAHLRSLAPLPKAEYLALRSAILELGSIGRNLNQIARAANQGERVAGPGRDDLRTMLMLCQGLRDHVKALLRANLRAWEHGHAGSDA